MSVIVSLYESVNFLEAALEDFNAKTENYKILPKDPAVGIRPLLLELTLGNLDDMLSERRKWCPRGERMLQTLQRLVPWFDNTDCRVISDVFDDVVLHPWTVFMSSYHQFHDNQPYSVVFIRPHGRWDAIISEPEDYRIMDWERRMGNGEWSNKSMRLRVGCI